MTVTSKSRYKVGLSALLLSPQHGTYRQAGIHSYIHGILSNLPAEHAALSYTALVAAGAAKFDAPLLLRNVSPATRRPLVRILWEQFVQPLVCNSERFDLLHAMAFVAPLLAALPTVVTIYDLTFQKLPQNFRAANRAYLSLFARLSCRRAARVIAISHNTKRDVVQAYGIEDRRVDVIYPGLRAGMQRAEPRAVAEFREQRGLPARFVLYLGTIEPRKNLSVLVAAYKLAQLKDVKLVCAGGEGWMYSDVFLAVAELQLSRDVLFPGFVPEADLPLWYSAAEAFVYPSAYEGFGLPVLEALACGTPVITTTAGSLVEVAGGAALLCPPDDAPTLADAIVRVINEPAIREQLAAAGPVQAQRFCWQDAGKRTAATHLRALQPERT